MAKDKGCRSFLTRRLYLSRLPGCHLSALSLRGGILMRGIGGEKTITANGATGTRGVVEGPCLSETRKSTEPRTPQKPRTANLGIWLKWMRFGNLELKNGFNHERHENSRKAYRFSLPQVKQARLLKRGMNRLRIPCSMKATKAHECTRRIIFVSARRADLCELVAKLFDCND